MADAANEFRSEPELFCGLSVAKIKCALGCLGIKTARALYRMPTQKRAHTPGDEVITDL